MPCSMWVDIRFNVTYVGGMSEGGRDHLRVIKKKVFFKKEHLGADVRFHKLAGKHELDEAHETQASQQLLLTLAIFT